MISPEYTGEAEKMRPFIRQYYQNDGHVRMNHPELVVLKRVFDNISENLKLHRTLNIQCGSCVCDALKIVEAYLPTKTEERATPKVINMVRKKKAETHQPKEVKPEEMKWGPLKTYAKEKGINVHKKTIEQILNELKA